MNIGMRQLGSIVGFDMMQNRDHSIATDVEFQIAIVFSKVRHSNSKFSPLLRFHIEDRKENRRRNGAIAGTEVSQHIETIVEPASLHATRILKKRVRSIKLNTHN